VALGALGKRERDDGSTCALAATELPAVRRQAAKVAVESLALAIVATAVIWIL
jgi:hypothetical protein